MRPTDGPIRFIRLVMEWPRLNAEPGSRSNSIRLSSEQGSRNMALTIHSMRRILILKKRWKVIVEDDACLNRQKAYWPWLFHGLFTYDPLKKKFLYSPFKENLYALISMPKL